MSENQYLGSLENYEVPPYKKPKVKFLAYIISFFYLVFVCFPLFLLVYVFVDIAFFIRDSIRFIKKTIKNAKTKFKSKLTKRVS